MPEELGDDDDEEEEVEEEEEDDVYKNPCCICLNGDSKATNLIVYCDNCDHGDFFFFPSLPFL